MSEKDKLLSQLDAKIKRTQKLADEAQIWANRLSTLRNNLDVLKRARELLVETDNEETARPWVPVFSSAPRDYVQGLESGGDTTHLSIGATAEKILREAGSEMSLQEIWENLKVNGRPEVPLKTLGGVISQYVAKGRIKRTGRATYRAAILHAGGGRLAGEQP
jgi:hypothetical protein